MFRKTLLALAAVAGIFGFGAVVESMPAEAQGMHAHRPPMRHFGGPGPSARYYHPPRRHWNNHRHGWNRGWYRGGVWVTPPGVYGYYNSDCRIVRRQVRVWTDYGWRLRWRNQRICYD